MFGHKRIPSREGGVEIVVGELSTRMAALGHEVTCINRRGHHVGGRQFDAEQNDNFRGVRLRSVPTWDVKGLAAVTSSFFAAAAAAFSNADAVHIHAEGPAAFCWIPKLFGKKVVVTIHGLDWQREKWKRGFGSKFIHWGERAAVRFADEIVVLSEGVGQYFRDTYGRETVFIPNGVSCPDCLPAREITQQFGLCKDSYILYLGRLVPEKGAAYLIDAFRSVRTEKKLVIAGGSSDTDAFAAELKRSAAGDERILFTGFVQGGILEELYSNAYVYVLPSDLEGMPLSLLEAMSYGNCCVTSDIEECAAVTGDYGLIFPRGDVEALRDLLQILCDDSRRVCHFRSISRDYITRKYNWDDVTKKTLELYR
ncbi:MAG: glycosyltransferase family 4 protein [Oscillospiraceae bacterium]|nr:glycosyltransferase family 4 protein [Oscillospiraceae bacterium]